MKTLLLVLLCSAVYAEEAKVKTVTVKLNAGVFEDALPFDEPFLIKGKMAKGITQVSMSYEGKRDLPLFRIPGESSPEPSTGDGVWKSNGLKDPTEFQIYVKKPLDNRRTYTFEFYHTKSKADPAKVAQRVSDVQKLVYPDDPNNNDRLRQLDNIKDELKAFGNGTAIFPGLTESEWFDVLTRDITVYKEWQVRDVAAVAVYLIECRDCFQKLLSGKKKIANYQVVDSKKLDEDSLKLLRAFFYYLAQGSLTPKIPLIKDPAQKADIVKLEAALRKLLSELQNKILSEKVVLATIKPVRPQVKLAQYVRPDLAYARGQGGSYFIYSSVHFHGAPVNPEVSLRGLDLPFRDALAKRASFFIGVSVVDLAPGSNKTNILLDGQGVVGLGFRDPFFFCGDDFRFLEGVRINGGWVAYGAKKKTSTTISRVRQVADTTIREGGDPIVRSWEEVQILPATDSMEPSEDFQHKIEITEKKKDVLKWDWFVSVSLEFSLKSVLGKFSALMP